MMKSSVNHKSVTLMTFAAVVLGFSASAAAESQPEPELLSRAPAEDAPPLTGYDGGFFIRGADAPFELKLQGRVQARYTLELPEQGTDASAFSIPRARITLKGHAFTKELGYKFQADFGKGFVTLKDFYVDYAFMPGALQLRVGQYKRPFSRQQITSSGNLELVDRAITDRFFGAGRDIGLAVHNNYEKSPEFEYAFGIFNGTGDSSELSGDVLVDPATGEGQIVDGKFSNVPGRFSPALVLRVGYNSERMKGYSEADLEGGPLRFGVGASGIVNFDVDDDDEAGVRGELDYALKIHGASTTGAVYLASAQTGAEFSDQSFEAVGFHVQAGYVIAERVQPAVRYARISPDGPDNDLQEILGGISLYFFEHGFKWQTDGGALLTEESGGQSTDFLVRSQLQLAF